MKKAIVLLLVIAVSAGFAIANDKPLDNEDYTIQNPSRIIITGTLDDSSPMWERGYDYSAPPAPTCDFPFTDHGSDAAPYDQVCIQVTDTNPIEVVVVQDQTTISDTTLYLFCEGFDAAYPLEQGVFWDDDGGDGLMSAFTLTDNIVLDPDATYWLVLSTYYHTTTLGDYYIETSDNVVLCGGVGTENTDFSSIRALFR